MKKTWNVKIDEQMYNVELKNRKLIVNGEQMKLNSKLRKKMGLVHEEYEVPIGSKRALIVIKSMGAPQLVIDNRDCGTGEEYVPVKLPIWSYLFVALHFVNFINGAVGCLIAVCGLVITASVSCNKNLNIVVRVLLNVAVVVLAYAVVFGVAFAVSGLVY